MCNLVMLSYSFENWLDEHQTDIFNEQNSTIPEVQLDFVYHNYAALTSYLKNVSEKYPNITHLYSIGKSVEGFNDSNVTNLIRIYIYLFSMKRSGFVGLGRFFNTRSSRPG